MATRTRRSHAAVCKAHVALPGDKTLAERAQQFDVHPNQITEWKSTEETRAAVQTNGATSLVLRRDFSRSLEYLSTQIEAGTSIGMKPISFAIPDVYRAGDSFCGCLEAWRQRKPGLNDEYCTDPCGLCAPP